MPSLVDTQGTVTLPYPVAEVYHEALNPIHVLSHDLSLVKLQYDEEILRQGARFRANVHEINLPFSVEVQRLLPNKHIGLHGSKFGLADVRVGINFEQANNDETQVGYSLNISLGRIGLTFARALNAHEKALEDSDTLVTGILGSIHRAIATNRAA